MGRGRWKITNWVGTAIALAGVSLLTSTPEYAGVALALLMGGAGIALAALMAMGKTSGYEGEPADPDLHVYPSHESPPKR